MTSKTPERIAASELLEENVKMRVGTAKKYRSLAKLAEAIGVSAPSLTHALKNNPSLSTIQKIADTLGVSVASLFYDRRKVEGYVSVGGHITHFHTEEELHNALKVQTITFKKTALHESIT